MDILTISPEYADRLLKWLVGAYKLTAHHGGFATSLTGLGRLDCALRSVDKLYYDFITGKKKVGEPGDVLIDFPCLSGLWTMGMYEGIRTLSQKLRNDAKLGNAHPAAEDVRLLRIRFERVRIPLAKFEPASKFPTDHNYLSQHIGKPDGWGWVVADKTVVYRNSLADEVLNLFDKFEDTEASLLFKNKWPNNGFQRTAKKLHFLARLRRRFAGR